MALSKTRQGRKQRLRAAFAPAHVRKKWVNAPLSRELRKKAGKRTETVRKGDEVVVLAGKFRKTKAKVSNVDVINSRVYLEGVFVKTAKGREVPIGLKANSLVITTLSERQNKPKKQPKPKKAVAATPVAAPVKN
jgi:large subunit ribosomal protein L24